MRPNIFRDNRIAEYRLVVIVLFSKLKVSMTKCTFLSSTLFMRHINSEFSSYLLYNKSSEFCIKE